MRKWIALAVFAVALPAIAQTPQQRAPQEIVLTVGSADIVKLARQASSLVSADQTIAVTGLIDPSTISIIGRKQGVTAFIAVDETGTEIGRWSVRVGNPMATHRVFHEDKLTEYQCDPLCAKKEGPGGAQGQFIFRDAAGNVIGTSTSNIETRR